MGLWFLGKAFSWMHATHWKTHRLTILNAENNIILGLPQLTGILYRFETLISAGFERCHLLNNKSKEIIYRYGCLRVSTAGQKDSVNKDIERWLSKRTIICGEIISKEWILYSDPITLGTDIYDSLKIICQETIDLSNPDYIGEKIMELIWSHVSY